MHIPVQVKVWPAITRTDRAGQQPRSIEHRSVPAFREREGEREREIYQSLACIYSIEHRSVLRQVRSRDRVLLWNPRDPNTSTGHAQAGRHRDAVDSAGCAEAGHREGGDAWHSKQSDGSARADTGADL